MRFIKQSRPSPGFPAEARDVGTTNAQQMTARALEIGAVNERIGGHFTHHQPRRRAVGYVRDPLSGTERKHGWQLAEDLSAPALDGADWIANAVRDAHIGYLREHLGHPNGVRVIDGPGSSRRVRSSVALLANIQTPPAHRERPNQGVPRVRNKEGASATRPHTVPTQ